MSNNAVRFRLIDKQYITYAGEEIPTSTLLKCSHEIAGSEGVLWYEKLAKVALCKCGCGKAIMAATVPYAWEDATTRSEFATYQVRGHRILLVTPEWVRKNWTEHEEPEQLSLF